MKVINKKTKNWHLVLGYHDNKLQNIKVIWDLHDRVPSEKKLPYNLMTNINRYLEKNKNIIYNEAILHKLLDKYIIDHDI